MPYQDLTFGSIIYTLSVSEDEGNNWITLTDYCCYWLRSYSSNLTLEGTPAEEKLY